VIGKILQRHFRFLIRHQTVVMAPPDMTAQQKIDEELELERLVNGKSSLDDLEDLDDLEVPPEAYNLDIDPPGESRITQRTERWTKLFVLALACTFSVGSHYSQDCIGPLKDILKEDLNITDSQMSLILGSNLVANTIVPIVAGLLVAKFGLLKCSLFATGVLFVGQAINLIALIFQSVPGMIFGLCLFGYILPCLHTKL